MTNTISTAVLDRFADLERERQNTCVQCIRLERPCGGGHDNSNRADWDHTPAEANRIAEFRAAH
ncbi:hypothetical protein KDJ57_gp01 [Gordonia phage Catfish]|uniref:Uncharacterized protein n=1 Tax=Gordonia phage Catfish TaxID=2301538 RepID=A0A385D0I5_9CAUD|nr:hypothetical protein KDJ57_gp01 [Gordonia phage Catfish]AXQ51838.1 hypothetical protein SEA_CATFISH_1 [Gordonia phage Catfish]